MNTQGSAIPLTRLFLAIGLMVASVHLMIACESASDQVDQKESDTVEQAAPEPVGYVGSDGVRRVTAEQAKMLVDQDRAVLVDTRGSASFMRARASGALLASVTEINQDRVGALADVPEHKELVLY